MPSEMCKLKDAYYKYDPHCEVIKININLPNMKWSESVVTFLSRAKKFSIDGHYYIDHWHFARVYNKHCNTSFICQKV